MYKLFAILSVLLLSTACNMGTLLSSVEEQEPKGPGVVVCIVTDTMPRYFHGDFDHDGVADSSRIMLHRCG